MATLIHVALVVVAYEAARRGAHAGPGPAQCPACLGATPTARGECIGAEYVIASAWAPCATPCGSSHGCCRVHAFWGEASKTCDDGVPDAVDWTSGRRQSQSQNPTRPMTTSPNLSPRSSPSPTSPSWTNFLLREGRGVAP